MSNKQTVQELEPFLIEKMNFNRLARVGLFVRLELHENTYSIENELLLNRSILDRALLDMFSPDKEVRKDVFDWLNLDNPDFIFICKELCLLEPEKVYETFKQVYKIINESKKLKKSKRKKDKESC